MIFLLCNTSIVTSECRLSWLSLVSDGTGFAPHSCTMWRSGQWKTPNGRGRLRAGTDQWKTPSGRGRLSLRASLSGTFLQRRKDVVNQYLSLGQTQSQSQHRPVEDAVCGVKGADLERSGRGRLRAEWKGQTESGVKGADLERSGRGRLRAEWKGQTQSGVEGADWERSGRGRPRAEWKGQTQSGVEGADSERSGRGRLRAEWKGQTQSGVEGADSERSGRGRLRAEWKGQTQRWERSGRGRLSRPVSGQHGAGAASWAVRALSCSVNDTENYIESRIYKCNPAQAPDLKYPSELH